MSTPSVCSPSSSGSTASEPGGIGAPVEITTAVPASSGTSPADPAATSPRTGRDTGGDAKSSERTAQPSIEERSKPGRSTAPRTSALSTRPAASASGTVSPGSGRAFAPIRS